MSNDSTRKALAGMRSHDRAGRAFAGRRAAGLTSVELAMFAAAVLLVASFGVPRFRDAVERSKAGEAFHYLNIVRVAEARHRTQHGTYTDRIEESEIDLPPLKFFFAGTVEPGDRGIADSWRMTLVRRGPAAGYGAYTVTYTEQGFDRERSTIVAVPTINPFADNRMPGDDEARLGRRAFVNTR